MLTLVVPYFNEGRKIVNAYKILTRFFKQKSIIYELIFVNDGSTDDSTIFLKKTINKDANVKLISYNKNRGRGYAVRQGFIKAKGKFIGYIDSDLEINPKYIIACLIQLNGSDAAIVSKHHPASKINTPLSRRIASKFFNWWIKLILGTNINDHQAGLKIFKRKTLSDVLWKVQANDWLFDVELLYFIFKAKYRVTEVPISIRYGFKKFQLSLYKSFIRAFFYVIYLRKYSSLK